MAPPHSEENQEQVDDIQVTPSTPHTPPHNCFWSNEVKQMLIEQRQRDGEIRALYMLLKRQQSQQAEKERQLERLSGDIGRVAGNALVTVEHVLKAQTALVETTKTTNAALQHVGQLQKSDDNQTAQISALDTRIAAVSTIQDRQKWWIRGGAAVISAVGVAIVFLGNTCDLVKKGRDMYMEQQQHQQQHQSQYPTAPAGTIPTAPTVIPASIPPHP